MVTCLVAGGCSSGRPPVFEVGATLEQKLETTRQHLDLPGVVVTVVRGDELLVDRAFGVADLETGEALTREHAFRVASLAKPVVATLVLLLVDEGIFRLDDPISAWLPDVPNGDNITIRMLLQHTSGLRNYIALPEVKAAFASEPTRSWTEAELLEFAFEAGPHFEPPGDGWMYSNTNYVLLGQLIETLEGRPLDDVLQSRICTPLGLENTFYSIDASIPEPFAKGYQMGDESGPIFWAGKGSIHYDVTDASPSMWHAAGAMVSTLDDTRTLIEAITSGALLSEELFHEQTTWRDSGYPVDYSYGLGLVNYDGTIGHSGNEPGYQVTALTEPDLDLTVVVLTNLYSSFNYEDPANAMFFVIMKHLTGDSYAPPGWGGW
ncbi:MAG: serine hydrolase domain-containing protein [Planctomycetota bacterium]